MLRRREQEHEQSVVGVLFSSAGRVTGCRLCLPVLATRPAAFSTGWVLSSQVLLVLSRLTPNVACVLLFVLGLPSAARDE